MYLKEIKVSGFKSFADKININLDDNITCIVGPNGSGKSNIIDAVRWVLGEQSIKNLRGSNAMTDVIFSGSKSRNPLNLASVTLVFDNSDSYLKVPYTEISITRKVYRSGENEYYLNNEKCRLKDINDLFLDSGMGKYAFNIISQGQVEKVVSDTPQERRVIFEEAAGVLKYKKRKEEALHKLDKTNENLNRVFDILNELETQVGPLKEQSEKAKKYLNVKEKLEGIEVALIADDLEKLNVSYKDTNKKIEELQQEIVGLNTKSSNDDVSLIKKKEELDEINRKMVALNNEYIVLTKEEERINGERNIIKERSKYDANDLKVHENISNLQEQKLLLNNKLLSLKTDIDIIDKKIKEKLENINKINDDLGTKNEVKQQLENDIYAKQKEMTNLSYKIKSLEGYILEGGSTNSNVKRVLSNPTLKGVHNTIANLISIDEKYALALEVALGGSKDYVVVDTTEVAKKAINYLKENNYGRVTFYPKDVIKPRYIEDEIVALLNKEPGFIDIMSNLVSCDNKYADIIKNRLGNVLLVDDIDNANNLAKKTKNKFVITTLGGEIINVGGSITGGSLKQKSVISEKHELQLLTSKYDLLTDEIKDLEIKLKQENEDIEKIKETLRNAEHEKLILTEEFTTKKSSYDETKISFSEKELELSNLDDLVNDNISKEEEEITKKYYKVLNEKEELGKKVGVITSEKEKCEQEIEKLQSNFRLSNSNIHQKEQELKELEITNTKMSVKMDNLLNILSETYEMTFEKAKQDYILEIAPEVARSEVNDYKKQLKEIGEVNIASIEEYDRVSKRYDFLTKQSDDLKNAIATLLSIIDELDEVMKSEFIKTFKEVEVEFDKVFKDLFGGGSAKLSLTDENNLLETGIEINAMPPGKKVSTISLLSGGEKTLTAISLLFAILNIKKVPFCLFDEIEAALDEANVAKVGEYCNKYSSRTQLIIITHKKKTMEYANTLYGITMQESGVSKLVSVKLV